MRFVVAVVKAEQTPPVVAGRVAGVGFNFQRPAYPQWRLVWVIPYKVHAVFVALGGFDDAKTGLLPQLGL